MNLEIKILIFIKVLVKLGESENSSSERVYREGSVKPWEKESAKEAQKEQ